MNRRDKAFILVIVINSFALITQAIQLERQRKERTELLQTIREQTNYMQRQNKLIEVITQKD